MAMWKYLIPQIAWADVPIMLGLGAVGSIVAGSYGIVHDQITYTISPEYFTKYKFAQFHYADFGWPERVFVGTIGFLATWWVGFVAGWFLARRLIPNQPRPRAFRQIRNGIICILSMGFLFGLIGFGYGVSCGPDADYASSEEILRRLGVTEVYAFMRVAYIHNAGYLGGLVGLIVALAGIRPEQTKSIAAICPDTSTLSRLQKTSE